MITTPFSVSQPSGSLEGDSAARRSAHWLADALKGEVDAAVVAVEAGAEQPEIVVIEADAVNGVIEALDYATVEVGLGVAEGLRRDEQPDQAEQKRAAQGRKSHHARIHPIQTS